MISTREKCILFWWFVFFIRLWNSFWDLRLHMSHVVSVHVGCCCGACWSQALAEYREAQPVQLVFLYVCHILFFFFFYIFACRTDRHVHTWRWMTFYQALGMGDGVQYQNKWWNWDKTSWNSNKANFAFSHVFIFSLFWQKNGLVLLF